MAQYTAPLRDIAFVMHEVLDVASTLKGLPAQAEVNAELIDQVVEEGGKFCAEVLFPLNQVGDREGCVLDKTAHTVKTPTGFKEAFAKFCEAGWPGLSCDPEFGGQGLPHVVQTAFQEMMNSANQAWAMYPGLTHGAYQALVKHGDAARGKVLIRQAIDSKAELPKLNEARDLLARG